MRQLKKKDEKQAAQMPASKANSKKPPKFSLKTGQGDKNSKSGQPNPTDKYSEATHQPISGGTLYSQGTGDTDEIALNDITQGDLGDCYFLAALGALARTNPDAIRNMIKDNGDGTYDVTLYDYNYFFSTERSPQVVTVKPEFMTTDSGVHPYTKTGDNNEFWVMLIEKAFAQYEGGYSDIEGHNYGGNALELLTGKTQTRVQISSLTEAEIITNLKTLVDDGYAITIGSVQSEEGSKKTLAAGNAGILTNHDYVVRGVDEQNKTLNLYNPWGRKHLPAIPVADVKQFFRRYDAVK